MSYDSFPSWQCRFSPWLSAAVGWLLFMATQAVFAAETGNSPPAKPSFACEKGKNWVEHKICDDRYLSEADSWLAKIYFQLLDRDPDAAEELKSRERNWLEGRNQCHDAMREGSEAMNPLDCLRWGYDERIFYLENILAQHGVNGEIQANGDVCSTADSLLHSPKRWTLLYPIGVIKIDKYMSGEQLRADFGKEVVDSMVRASGRDDSPDPFPTTIEISHISIWPTEPAAWLFSTSEGSLHEPTHWLFHGATREKNSIPGELSGVFTNDYKLKPHILGSFEINFIRFNGEPYVVEWGEWVGSAVVQIARTSGQGICSFELK